MWLIDVEGTAINAALVSKVFISGDSDFTFAVKANIADEDEYFTLAFFEDGEPAENYAAARDYLEKLVKQLNE